MDKLHQNKPDSAVGAEQVCTAAAGPSDNRPKISVIIPVYNTGGILGQTINSVLNQTFRDFELILVDDGSTDVSGEVCDSFAQQDPRVVVIHKKNGGICEARNTGIENARGAYLTFCDHDDLYMPTILQTEWETAAREKADMVVVGKVEEKDGVKDIARYNFCYDKAQIQEHMLEILESKALFCVWNILYSRQRLETARFHTDYKRGHEDFVFNFEILPQVQKLCAIEEPLYIHIVRENMSTSAKVYKETVPAMAHACNCIYDLILNSKIDLERRKKDIVCFHGNLVRSCLAYAVKAGLSYQEYLILVDNLKFLPEKNFLKIQGARLRTKVTCVLLSRGWLRILYGILYVHGRWKNRRLK